jgi:hypothetical protein
MATLPLPHLPATTILLVEVGSTAHGTGSIETHHSVWADLDPAPA